MTTYTAPVDDMMFILKDVLQLSNYNALPGFDTLDDETLRAMIEEGAKVCEERLHPLNAVGDSQGCTRRQDAVVTTPAGFREAYDAYREGGWIGLHLPVEYGGLGLPATLNAVMQEFVSSSNLALGMYPGLTQGAIAALIEHASDELKTRYVPNMVAGEWSGTMNLTEPQCGTDLGLIRTRAVPNGDGAYRISGQKIFISAGEHDMTSNIIHLVLARIEGAPAGTKGISLFVCPKFLVNEDGSIGARNGVTCGKIEEKMGIHGNSTCVMDFDEATGYLVGEENKGLAAMFVMMNEARLAVGIQGLAMGEIATQNAAVYARERLQGRALSGPQDPSKSADPLMVHPDVRRTLMTNRAMTQGGRALALATALQSDLLHRSDDAKARQAADDRLGLMTPVVKAILTDQGFEQAVSAQQMFGGHGYIGETGVEQFVRDARITMIYEGANGVQAMDLVGRKLGRDGGRAIMSFFGEVKQFLAKDGGAEEMKPYVATLGDAVDHLQQATMWLMQNGMANPDNAGAAATDYLYLLGLTAIGHQWALMAKVALKAPETPFNSAKLTTARFYAERILPETALRLARIKTGAANVMALPADAF